MWRLLDHEPGPSRWNMAVDAALLRSHAEASGPPTLRFYQWSRPTLSLGAGQKLPDSELRERLQSLGLALVRRSTGGRAVLHGGDLTYCIVAGVREGFQPSVTAVYRRLCRGLETGFRRLGLTASPGAPLSSPAGSFCCFAAAASGDFAWQGRKFAGSAQVWQGQSFLQHGAILLTPQTAAWQRLFGTAGRGTPLPMISLSEILGRLPPLRSLKTALREGLQEELGVTFTDGELTPWEHRCLAAALEPLPATTPNP